METDFIENVDYTEYLSASSDDEPFSGDSTDDSDDEALCSDYELRDSIKKRVTYENGGTTVPNGSPINLVHKLYNREHSNCFTGNAKQHNISHRAFSNVPNRLRFCLKDIVPHRYLQSHMFMGLTACGQFLISYKIGSDDNVNPNSYSFNCCHKYTIYFWIYQPNRMPRIFYTTCLFDDHGVDGYKEVTITQWKSEPHILIVHGAAEVENENSYITYIKVPRLGCLDCKKYRELDGECLMHCNSLCLKCSLTIHTKYSPTDSERKFNPHVNLICPGRILIVANGFMHMLHIDLELSIIQTSSSIQLPNLNPSSSSLLFAQVPCSPSLESSVGEHGAVLCPNYKSRDEIVVGCDNHNNIVARIIADFSDIESDSTLSTNDVRRKSQGVGDCSTSSTMTAICAPLKTCDELVFTCSATSAGGSADSESSSLKGGIDSNSAVSSSKGPSGVSGKVSLLRHREGKRHYRIVSKSYRNGLTTVDLPDSGPTTSTVVDKSNAYEFSEDNEKCEKISTLRKRRLADKKYEFSEDNSENIIPFTKIRSARKMISSAHFGQPSPSTSNQTLRMHRPSPTSHYFPNSPTASPSSSPHPSHASSPGHDARHCTPPPLHRASPISYSSVQQGFRSPPCSSPVGVGGIMRSPSRTVTMAQIYSQRSPPAPLLTGAQQLLNFKPLGTLSPLQVSMAKRNHLELNSSMSPNANVPFLSPCREEHHRVVEISFQDNAIPEKPICTKKFKRRYVEEDDAASVITSEEDDCISPGYHTSLPMEVHGACYSEMQMISQASYQQLNCASVVVTQHSFDLEAFTYYVISALCQKNQKTYDVFLDWACEIINVCPLSHTISCLLMAQFTARDQLPTSPTNCINCLRRIDCAFHRHKYECRILFTWNMETGKWEVLNYGELTNLMNTDFVSPMKRTNKPLEPCLTQRARRLANEIASGISKLQDYTSTLRVLDSDVTKPKKRIVDYDNMIEFHLKRPRYAAE